MYFGLAMKNASQANIPATKGNGTASPAKYILCKRVGKKWLGIAGTASATASCLSAAETVFAANGLIGEAQWHTVETQKNYIGRDAAFVIVECSQRKADVYWLRNAVSRHYYPTFESLCESQPFAAEYRAELADIFAAKTLAWERTPPRKSLTRRRIWHATR